MHNEGKYKHVKRQPSEWEKTITNETAHRELISKKYLAVTYVKECSAYVLF